MIYFDNAATTYPKPPQVIRAVSNSLKTCGNPGRGAHSLAMCAAKEIYDCRKAAAELFNASPERVIITSGATHSLNMAIGAHKSREGAIIISDLEHNSVLRPTLASTKEVRIFSSALYMNGDDRTAAILASIDSLSQGASMLVTTAVSNVCGASLPIADIGAYCRDRGIFFIVDGAQAGGTHDIDMVRDCIDILCLPGHKGLYGPMGCGLMILGENVELPPFMLGGSGVDSRSRTMPELPPERYEAGTLPLVLISGLRRGIEFVKIKSPAAILAHEKKLAAMMKQGLDSSHVRIFLPECESGIVLFTVNGFAAEEVAAFLDEHGICTRAGLHCSPLAHDSIGSEGAVRVSFSIYNTEDEVRAFCQKIRLLCKNKP